MRTVNVEDLKTHFSQILKEVENGEKILIVGGKHSKKLAVLVPFHEYFRQARKVGLLSKRGKVTFTKEWEMTDKELITL
jgi:prevent-host-death family protein